MQIILSTRTLSTEELHLWLRNGDKIVTILTDRLKL